MQGICSQVQNLVDNTLIPNSQNEPRAEVFYHKTKGDFLRYSAETSEGETRDRISKQSLTSYEKAVEISTQNLKPADSLYLGLMLNFSVFRFEILGDKKTAIEEASKTFSKAVERLDDLDEDEYKDSTIVLQLLRDNISLWQHEDNESDDELEVDQEIPSEHEHEQQQEQTEFSSDSGAIMQLLKDNLDAWNNNHDVEA